MKAQILFVAPFKKLAEDAKLVIDEKFPDKKDLFKIVEGDLNEAESIVKEQIKIDDGIEVIVSRGGTASLIEMNIDIPIVCVQVTITDILQAVLDSHTVSNNIGIAGFENMIYGCDEIAKILNISFTELLIHEEKEANEKILTAINKGIDLFIGDAISVKVAKKYGVEAKFINSGKQSIYRALQEALLIAKVRRQDEHKSQMIRAIINKAHDGIVAVDENNKITLFNPEAERIFHRVKYEILEKQFDDLNLKIDKKKLKEENEVLVEIYRKQYLVKNTPLVVKKHKEGSIYTLQNVSEVQRLERNIRKKLSSKGLVAKYRMDDIIGQSDACIKMKNKARKYALTNSTILITGESGTGKEILVQSIHNMSSRAQGPFIALNCAALPENLLESELFGYVDGAFTGAKRGGRQGMFELAHGGTLFLDEIGEMPLSLQSRILRVLQEREVMPLGGESIIPIDVRIIAATNQNLAQMVEDGKFRSDLYYRLNILRIHMPTLEERKSDIPLLAEHLISNMKDINSQIKGITKEAKVFLMECNWPGNIRQFLNMMERIMLLTDGNIITKQSIIDAYEDDLREENYVKENSKDIEVTRENKIDLNKHHTSVGSSNTYKNLAQMEYAFLEQVLAQEDYNYTKAAKRLGIHRTTLWRKLKRKGDK